MDLAGVGSLLFLELWMLTALPTPTCKFIFTSSSIRISLICKSTPSDFLFFVKERQPRIYENPGQRIQNLGVHRSSIFIASMTIVAAEIDL